MKILDWDYSNLAAFYDFRIDYAQNIVKHICMEANLEPNQNVLEIGAGTGKLSKLLVDFGFKIDAVEPNSEMLSKGKENIKSNNINWHNFAAEEINFSINRFNSVWFGSSLNVVNFEKTIANINTIVKKDSWLICLWNHRDLENQIQKNIESIILSYIPNFNYGTRRIDPTNQSTILRLSSIIRIGKIFI